MKTKLMVTAAASVLLFGSAAFAQSASSASGGASSGAQAGAAAQADFTDDQLKSFAEVTLDLQRRQAQGALDPAAMSAAVEQSGLTVDQYNQIATRMRTDQAFNTRVQQLAQAGAGESSRGGASSSSQSTESMTAAPGASPSTGSMGRDAGDSTAPPSGGSDR